MRHANAPARSLAFPSMRRERERSQRLFDIDIEASFRDWMTAMLGGDERAEERLRRRMAGLPVRNQPRWSVPEDMLDLSTRERECLTLMACGYTRRQTGDILHLSFETVKQYLDRGRAKMRAESNNQAAFIAILIGELDLPLMREHLFRGWDSPGLARPGRPVAA